MVLSHRRLRAYRGYFSERKADEFAAELRAQGFEAIVEWRGLPIRRWASSTIRS